MKLLRLYSRRSDGKVQFWEKEVEGGKHRTHSGIEGGKIVTTKWTVCTAKNVGKRNESKPEEQAVLEALAEHKKKTDKGYKDSLDQIDDSGYFEPMLAKVWQEHKDEVKYPVFVQPKLDGLRLIASKDGLFSRNGKPYASIPHIAEALKPLFKKHPQAILDGEVYADKFAEDFNKICKLARQMKPTTNDLAESAKYIEYHVYDFPSWPGEFSKRLMGLKKVLGALNDKRIVPVETHVAGTEASVIQWFEKMVEDGYEGLIVRADAKYENKRTTALLKYKEFSDAEYEIVDVCEGLGNRSGGAGYIVCKKADGSTFRSNIKGTREFCAKMLKNKDDYIGKMGTIKYANLTPDGVPRFPYFMRLRGAE